MAELGERIRQLRESVTVEAAPDRVTRKGVRTERPVTARIGEGRGLVEPESAEESVSEGRVTPMEILAVAVPMPESVRRDYRQAVMKKSQGSGQPLNLF